MAKVFQKDSGNSLTTSLVSYYKLSDTTDFYGSNNFTNNGATFGSGKINNGATTNGSSTYLQLAGGSNGPFQFTGNYSIALWVKPAASSSLGYIFGGHGLYYYLAVADATTKRFTWAIYNNSTYVKITSSVDIVDGNWYHVAGTYDGTNMRLYVNGSLDAGPTAVTAANGSTTGPRVGQWNNTSYFGGVVDELGIWSKALSTTEISDLYNSGNGQTMNPPIEALNLTASSSDTNATSYNTASITPTANRLVLASVYSRYNSSGNVPTLSGNGLTWVEVVTQRSSDNLLRNTIFRAMGASPSAGAVTIDFAGQTQEHCVWSITEFPGIDTSGTNGSGAIVQSGGNRIESAGNTGLTVTLSAFGSENNVAYGSTRAGNTIVAGSGLNQISQTTSAEYGNYQAEYGLNDNTVNWTWSASDSYSPGVALEIKAYVAPTTNIKSINGLAYASIKSVNGLATASMKNFNGLS